MEDEPVIKIDEEKERNFMTAAQLSQTLQINEIFRGVGVTVLLPTTFVVLDNNDQEIDRIPGPIVLSPNSFS